MSSRFSSLVEKEERKNKEKSVNKEKIADIVDIKESNNNTPNNNAFKTNRYNKERPIVEKPQKTEQQIKESLSLDNFPELVSKQIIIEQKNYEDGSFAEKLQSAVINEIDSDKILLPGWSLIQRNNITKQITIKQKEPVNGWHIEELNNDFEILDALTELHENRTSQYIEMWGYDEWENVFRFPNYNYHYFDELDELYQEQMEKEEEEERIEVEEYLESISDYE